jgi:hypothetical protein
VFPDVPQQQPAPQRFLPSKPQLDYAKVALELLLLVIAIPWILRELARDPAGLSRKAASKHLKGS